MEDNKYYLLSILAEDKIKIGKLKLYKLIKQNNNRFISIIFIIILMFFPSCLSKVNKSKKLISLSEISLEIKGIGEQYILSPKREEKIICENIIINGIENICKEDMLYILEKERNNVIIIWNNEFTNCNYLFYQLSNITYIDLSRFNSSLVQQSISMFDSCTSLTSINLKNFNTSLNQDMGNMFNNCSLLLELDLSGFNTSKSTSFGQMFGYCSLIKFLNLSNFDFSKSNYFHLMFKNCISLLSIEIKNFYAPNIININELFSGCSSLISLNLSTFYLDSNILRGDRVNDIFTGCNNKLRLCYEDNIFENMKENTTEYNVKNQFSKFNNNCSDICFKNEKNKFIVEESRCIDECFHDSYYKYEFNNICYSSCPNGTRNSFNNIYICEEGLICNIYYSYDHSKCLDSIPLGFYLNNTILKTLDKCIEKCSNCSKESLSYDLCISCNNELNYYAKYNDSSNNNLFINCYNEIPEGYYLDKINKIYRQCYYKCKNCNESGNEENHNCLECLPNYSFENGNYYKNFSSNIDECLNIDMKNNNFQILEKENNSSVYIYNIDTDIKEIMAQNTNITFIDFSLENIEFIKNQFNLKEGDKIYVIINDSISKDSNTATSDYNYKFFLKNGTELDITNISDDFYVNIYVPIRDLELSNYEYSILFSEKGYDIYNKNSSFYFDFCISVNIEENDIAIKDRRKDIYPNNITMCKSNCFYNGVNIEKKRISCSCNLNLNNNIFDDNNFFSEEEVDFLTYLLNQINYKIFKCYKTLSSFENLKYNFYFYIGMGYIFINIILIFIFYFKEISVIKLIISKNIPTNKKIKIEIQKELIKQREANRRKNNKIKLLINKKGKNNIKRNKKINSSLYSKTKLKTLNIYNDEKGSFENINDLPFNKAIIMDHRNVFLIFRTIFIKKLEFIGIFIGDDKLKILLLCHYLLSLLINLFFNTLLYTDDVVSNKYANNGDLDILISLILSIISNIITSIIDYALECTKYLEEIIEEIFLIKMKSIYINQLFALIKILKIKSSIFFSSEIIIIVFIFYYIFIFSIIYSKSKLSAFINFLYSLLESLIMAICISIIVTITRKISLFYKSKTLYYISKFINDKF